MSDDDDDIVDSLPPGTPDNMIFHVVPVNDLRDHISDSGQPCWCRPVIKSYGDGYIFMHNSMDRRELYQRGELKPN